MARALTVLISSLVCLLFCYAAQAQKSVFVLVKGDEQGFSLQEWDSTTLEPLKEWQLDQKIVRSPDQQIFVDRRSSKAVIRFHSRGGKLLILDLKSASQKVVADISPFRPITYRFEKGFLEALQPNPIQKEQGSHWKV